MKNWSIFLATALLILGCEKPPQSVALKPFPLTALMHERWSCEPIKHPQDSLITAVEIKFEGRNVLNVLDATRIPEIITPDTLVKRIAARKGKLFRRDSLKYGFGGIFDFSENTGAFGIPGEFHAPIYLPSRKSATSSNLALNTRRTCWSRA
jgi:hypothetical protein